MRLNELQNKLSRVKSACMTRLTNVDTGHCLSDKVVMEEFQLEFGEDAKMVIDMIFELEIYNEFSGDSE